jgi:hypothetical protein
LILELPENGTFGLALQKVAMSLYLAAHSRIEMQKNKFL